MPSRMVRGLQGAAGTSRIPGCAHVLATAKHFIGDGGTEAGVDRGDNLVYRAAAARHPWAGLRRRTEAGAQTVMASYNSWQGWKVHGQQLPAHGRAQEAAWDSTGLLVSDWDGIDEVQGCSKDRCAQAVNAGIDLFMVPTEWKPFIENTLEQVRGGRDRRGAHRRRRHAHSARETACRAVREGQAFVAPACQRARSSLGAAEHRAVARQAVRESLVLLKNKNGCVAAASATPRFSWPGTALTTSADKPAAGRITWQGTENTNADFPGATSIFAGIQAAVREGGRHSDAQRRRQLQDHDPTSRWSCSAKSPTRSGLGNMQVDRLPGSAAAATSALLARAAKEQGIPGRRRCF